MMNEKVRFWITVIGFFIFFLAIGAGIGWFGHRASIANRPVDTDTHILQERADELKERQSDIDSAFERGFGLLDQSEAAIRDGQGDAIRQLPRLELIGDGLDSTIRELEDAKRSGDRPHENVD
ncbi:MAG: hypothetical protein LBQ88_11065 [Treponema sp.]|jgi:hypothetical protein|nr:hypothetical protein [Treponema sp.]